MRTIIICKRSGYNRHLNHPRPKAIKEAGQVIGWHVKGQLFPSHNEAKRYARTILS